MKSKNTALAILGVVAIALIVLTLQNPPISQEMQQEIEVHGTGTTTYMFICRSAGGVVEINNIKEFNDFIHEYCVPSVNGWGKKER